MGICTVTNDKGGVGKTTFAAVLVAEMAKKGRRVLAVDMDPQANLTRRMRIPKEEMEQRISMAEVMRDIDTRPDLLKEIILPCQWDESFADNIDVAPSRTELGRWLGTGVASWLRLKTALSHVAGDYDDIIIDTPPGTGGALQNALVASDYVVLVTWPEMDSINGVHRIFEFIDSPKEGAAIGVAAKPIGIVINYINGQTKAHKGRIEEINAVWGDLVWQPPMPQTIRVQEAASEFAEPPQNGSPAAAVIAEALGEAYLKAVSG